jgi:5-methylcytosine-specific restriction endonuclease McrA
MGMTREQKRDRRAKKKLLRAARRILRDRHGVDPGYVNGLGSLLKYIAFHRPDLGTIQGLARVDAFVGGGVVADRERPANTPKQKLKRPRIDPNTDAFLESYEWRRVRMVVLKRDGARCACCGATPADGLRMNVDHIKPRRKYPELALDPANLQVLCEVCNHGKGNWDMTDWRHGEAANDSMERQHLRSIMEGTWAKRIGGEG